MWESITTAVEVGSIFLCLLGVGFTAMCALFDDRSESPLKRIRPYARFVALSYLVMVLLIIAGSLCLYFYGDDLDSPNTSGTSADYMTRVIGIIALWPMIVGFGWWDAAVSPHISDRSAFYLGSSLFLLTGVFWGSVAEVLIGLVARWRVKRQKPPS